MVEPYQAVGLIQSMRGIRRRAEIEWAPSTTSRTWSRRRPGYRAWTFRSLICIPEGGLQGFTDEVFDLDHEAYARECAIDIPGAETDNL